ncbi:MAG TPA: hypothetical protein VEU11_20085 [Terriglobales bacterium]|nr:hypothetical protein [Terriglobales bacterium]
MMATMAAGVLLVTAAGVSFGFFSMRGHAGARLLTWLELFSPSGQCQQQDCRKSDYQTLHRTLHVLLF